MSEPGPPKASSTTGRPSRNDGTLTRGNRTKRDEPPPTPGRRLKCFPGTTTTQHSTTAKGYGSTGRASVSKTEGWGFKSLYPCEHRGRSCGHRTRYQPKTGSKRHRANGQMAADHLSRPIQAKPQGITLMGATFNREANNRDTGVHTSPKPQHRGERFPQGEGAHNRYRQGEATHQVPEVPSAKLGTNTKQTRQRERTRATTPTVITDPTPQPRQPSQGRQRTGLDASNNPPGHRTPHVQPTCPSSMRNFVK
jgi:hypothetical protein